MNTFYVGQDVVCVKADYDPNQKVSIGSGLVEGKVYRIRWIGIYNHYLDGEYVGVRLEGINRGTCPIWGYDDVPFKAERFRPLVSDPLAVFRRIATDPDYKIDAPEGPLHPDGPLKEPEREKEVV